MDYVPKSEFEFQLEGKVYWITSGTDLEKKEKIGQSPFSAYHVDQLCVTLAPHGWINAQSQPFGM
jgi:hypothetical protein